MGGLNTKLLSKLQFGKIDAGKTALTSRA